MDFTRRQRQTNVNRIEYENLEQQYPHRVLIYKMPPTQNIRLEEFEDLAVERLRVLRILEQANLKSLRFLSDDWKEFVNAELTKDGLKGYLRLCSSTSGSGSSTSKTKWEADLQARRRDYISHFILRLAYCRSEELMRWFVTREMELFKYKFSALNSLEIKQFLELHNMNYIPLTEAEKDAVKDGLYESTFGQSVTKIEMLDFYKVPFTQVLDLVRSRRCYLKAGFAYVNTHDFVSIVAVTQLQEIEKGLKAAIRLSGHVETDERLFHLLKSLHTSYTGKDYALSKNANSVPIESLDQLSRKSFPLCMRVCHEHLRANHHLKYNGRMQYSLFLKGIGVTLEDSLRFWREEFTKAMDAEKFVKGGYEYNIQHNYGKKGSMINYTPYSCLKIIQETSQPGSVNGCPYKTYEPATLKTKLSANGLSCVHVQEVLKYVEKGHYQLACGKYFQIIHESLAETGINHPNQYFEESQSVMGKQVEKVSGSTRKPIKRPAVDATALDADDDAELWNATITEENTYRVKQFETSMCEEDLDLTSIAEVK